MRSTLHIYTLFLWLCMSAASVHGSHEYHHCEPCKEVTGQGPLAGIYNLVDQLAQPVDGYDCKDGCVYSKEDKMMMEDNEMMEDMEMMEDKDMMENMDRFCFSNKDMGYMSNSCQQGSSAQHSTNMPNMESTPMPPPPTQVVPLPPNLPRVVTIIEEDGEIVEQTDKFNIDTGEISIHVSSHRDVQQSTIIMGTRKGTLMRSTSDRCQIKAIPEDVEPESMLNSLDNVAGRTDLIRNSMEDTRYSVAVERGQASENDLSELSPAMKELCKDKPVKVTEEKTVSKEEFQNMAEGKLITLAGSSSNSRNKRDQCGSIKRVCTSRGSGCWRWPYGTSFSLHNLYQDAVCVDCCYQGGVSVEEVGLCQCSQITSLATLEACVTQINSTCPDGFYICGSSCLVETTGPMDKCNGNCPPNRIHCGDKCILPGDNYRECNGKCLLNNKACDGVCPKKTFTCKGSCISNERLKYYNVFPGCNGVCQLNTEPCNDICPEGMLKCGDKCRSSKGFGGDYRTCGDECLYESQPCDGTCPANRQLCEKIDVCIGLEDQSYRMCNGKCLSAIRPCNNSCPNTTYACGDKCYPDYMAGYAREEEGQCMFFREINQTKPQQSNTWPCDGAFIPEGDACHGQCPDERELCGNAKCKEEGNNQLRTCGKECLNALEPCEGECPKDRPFVCGGECFPTSYEQIRRDCNGECIDKDSPCLGDCPEESQILCDGVCIADNGFYHVCDGKCIHNTLPCNGICSGTMYLCGDTCYPDYVANFKRTCDGKCLDNSEPCNGECPQGWTLNGAKCEEDH